MVCLEGLGRYERGLARDLGLVKLASALGAAGSRPEETDALLAPYGEWAGLASVYLLAGSAGVSYPCRDAGSPPELHVVADPAAAVAALLAEQARARRLDRPDRRLDAGEGVRARRRARARLGRA